MKNTNRIKIFLVISLYLTITGCEKNDPDLPIADRNKFLGSYQCVSNGSGGQRNFNMTITASNSAPEQILMENFDLAGTGTFLAANVSGSTLSIISTSISGETYAGSGTISGDELSINFTLDDGQSVENRTATCNKI